MAMDVQQVITQYLTTEHKPELGDRTEYVGSSDLGCPRKAVLQKINPQPHSLKTCMKFKRGDIVEEMVGRALRDAYNPPPLSQLEVSYPDHPEYKAHIDFTFEGSKTIGVLECKSTERSVDVPYDSWNNQVQWQMGLLHTRYPKHAIKGAIACVDIKGGTIKVFNGFTYNENAFSRLLRKAKGVWDAIQAKSADAMATEQGILCEYCAYRMDCPALQINDDGSGAVMDLSPIRGDLDTYAETSLVKRDAEATLNNLRSSILDFVGDHEIGVLDGRPVRFSTVTQSRIDGKKLAAEYPDVAEAVRKTTSFRTIRM